MKYYRCSVMIGFEDKDVAIWSEHADLSFGLARKLNHGDNEVYLVDHGYDPVAPGQVDQFKTNVITIEGGV